MQMQNPINRRTFLKGSGSALLGASLAGALAGSGCREQQMTRAAALTAPTLKPIDTPRIGIVGVGVRGTEFVHILCDLKTARVTAVCDLHEDRAANAQAIVEKAGFEKPLAYTRGPEDFRRMCETQDLDLVIAATPVDWHVPVCVAAMKNGKDSATEVHATYDLDECWQLVEAAESTRRQCSLLENYCYIYNVMMVLNMVRQGVLGNLAHAEAGYQHDVRDVRFGSDGSLLWRAKDMLTHNGNLYPTHAVGPCAQWMNINRGDRFDYLVSMSSKSMGMNVYAREHFGPDHPSATREYKQGDVSTTLIRTVNGLTITLYYDAQLPRPYEMIYRVQGTKGIYLGLTDQIYLEGRSPNYHQYEPASRYYDQYGHPLWKALGDTARHYAHWGSDYLMMYRLVEAMRRGQPFDMDVYDAVSWSAISPLSEISVANRSTSVDFPDFTRGKWKTNPPLGIIGA